MQLVANRISNLDAAKIYKAIELNYEVIQGASYTGATNEVDCVKIDPVTSSTAGYDADDENVVSSSCG